MRSTQPQAGFTLIELMIVVSVLTIFMVTTLSYAVRQRAADHQHALYSRDLLATRAAMARIVTDLRGATATASAPSGIIIHTHQGIIRYGIEAGQLVRTSGASRQCIATCVRNLSCRQQGAVAHVRLVLTPRSPASGSREAAIQTSVALRLLARRRAG